MPHERDKPHSAFILQVFYTDEHGDKSFRLFNFANYGERNEFIRFTSWCLTNNREFTGRLFVEA